VAQSTGAGVAGAGAAAVWTGRGAATGAGVPATAVGVATAVWVLRLGFQLFQAGGQRLHLSTQGGDFIGADGAAWAKAEVASAARPTPAASAREVIMCSSAVGDYGQQA
jgi:hypothetical protein